MDVKLLFLTVVLLSSPLLTLCDPLFVLSAPNLLRVGSSENVFVEAQDYSGGDLNVKIFVKDHPDKHTEIWSRSVTLTAGNNFQILTDIMIPDDRGYFSNDPLKKQYVYLQAQFPSVTLEKVVMLSFQSGYIFVQTDKPIYTPDSTVKYRMFSLTPKMTSFTQSTIIVEIMNPQDITLSSEIIHPVKGTMSKHYALPEVTSLGIWKVVTWFSHSPQKKFTTNFEVKEYVLPTFEVTLKLSKSFFCVDDESLAVDIEAKYTFGQKVVGNAFVAFGVTDRERNRSIPTYSQKVQIKKGAGTAELTREMITKTFPNINQLVGRSIYVLVRVLTESGSEMVEAERRGIQIVTSPYTIHFKKTPQFFKPGMQFDVVVYVTYPDQTPAANVDVEVKPGPSSHPTRANGIAKFIINTQEGSSTLEITAKTKDPQLRDEQQAVKKMTAQAYKPKNGSDNYMDIDIDAAEFKIGDQIKVYLNTGKSPGFRDQDFTYMILSKGQIVKVDRFKKTGQSLMTLPVTVTKDMVPSFRILTYYHVGSSEVVSDSVWIDVKDTCMGMLQIKVKDKDKEDSYGTGDEVKLEITGDPGAKVGLVVVDKAVYVLNKNRLTQAKIWDVIEKHDTGCTAGGGSDSMGVFTDAGLMFESNTAGGTNTRETHECSGPAKRQRRAESHLQFKSTLARQYSGELEQCCIEGVRHNRLGYSCERRATYIIEGPECVKAFLHCCNEIKKHIKMTKEKDIVPRSDDDGDDYDYDYDEDDDDDNDDCIDSEHIVSRSHFPESWLWEDVYLPTCDKSKTSKTEKVIYLKDSITTWQILAVSLSPTLGICVAEPEEMVVFKHLFIDLRMPHSAVRGEQLEIKAIIHNYSEMNQRKVHVEFTETENVCSFSSRKGKYRTIVSIDKGSSTPVSYVIIPMTLGKHVIEVKASAHDSVHTDEVRKSLKVVSEGVRSQLPIRRVELNPAKNGEKPVVFKTNIPADRDPYTPANTYISITADEISQTVKQAISGSFMDHSINQPSGCGDQNMIRMTLPLIATQYLDHISQWEPVGMEHRNEAINQISIGYQGQLSYRSSEGSYASCDGRPNNTLRTAYVAKVFAKASHFIRIGNVVICSTLSWLVSHIQLPDGSFKKDLAVTHGEMVGGIESNDASASLTAFVLIAMQEGREICAELIGSLNESIRKAVSFLEGRLPKLTNPYAVAVTSYAMANVNKLNKDILMRHSTQGEASRSWTVSGQHYHSLEATAYAVLALVKAKDFDKAGEAVLWLKKQQIPYGGSAITQEAVFQAMVEYHMQVKNRQNVRLEVELAMAGGSRPVRYTFKTENMHRTHSVKVDINKEFTVTARGTGTATLSILTLYYARPAEKKSDCTFFDLTVKMEKDPRTKDQETTKTYKLTLEFIYKSDKTDATMTILNIGLPTGFSVEENDLKKLSTGKERYIQKYEKNKLLFGRETYILYLNKVSHKEIERIAFRMHKINDVGLLQPAAVTIYECYSPDAQCTKFYHPKRTDGALYRLCKEDLCQCAEEKCSYQKKNQVTDELRLNRSCEAGMDYVYKVSVVGMDLKQDSDSYDMKVEQVLKEGTDEDVHGKVRPFLARPSCREYLGLVKGNSYLIMGKSTDLPRFGGSLQYIFGEQTWVEYWPTREEGQTPEHRDRYMGISELQKSLLKHGCAK